MGIIKEHEIRSLAQEASKILKDTSKVEKERYDIVYQLTKGLSPRDFVMYSRALYVLMHEDKNENTRA